jgi:hypothetical protein
MARRAYQKTRRQSPGTPGAAGLFGDLAVRIARTVPVLRCVEIWPPMSHLGLGCVKTRRRATGTEETFIQIVDSCTNIP